MTPKISRNKIPTPTSIPAAERRLNVVNGEIWRIESHLDDPERPSKYPSEMEYKVWAGRARHAHKLFSAERVQLETWLETNLLQQAYDLLRVLKDDDALEGEELSLVKQLDEYFQIVNEEVRRHA